MQIKQAALKQQIQKKTAPLYWLTGSDTFFIEDSVQTIKAHIRSQYTCDEHTITIQSVEDWKKIIEETSSYSLFYDAHLITIIYDKKSLDATGKKVLTEYLNNLQPHCFLIVRAASIPQKSILWLSQHAHAVVVQATPLGADGVKKWIASELQKRSFSLAHQVPELIYQFTQGNMMACSQVLEKLALTHNSGTHITEEHAREQVSDQCEYALFELVDACLLGQGDKAIQILRNASNNKTEPTLVLWVLTQEVRVLLQLLFALQQQKDLSTACSQLKIWAQKIRLYQLAIKRFEYEKLCQLHGYCQYIDNQIKTNASSQVWNALEHLALALCFGTAAGVVCAH